MFSVKVLPISFLNIILPQACNSLANNLTAKIKQRNCCQYFLNIIAVLLILTSAKIFFT